MRKIFAFHAVVGTLLTFLFYGQFAIVAKTFSTHPLSEHSMRLVGLIFLLLTIVNLSVATDHVQRTLEHLFPQTSLAVFIAVMCNFALLIHYGLEAFYFRDVNLFVARTSFPLLALALTDFIPPFTELYSRYCSLHLFSTEWGCLLVFPSRRGRPLDYEAAFTLPKSLGPAATI